jgi:WD and tetratricopeptide repeat-containing protein 1
MLSLSDILYRSEANSDTSQDGARSDRDDSDYDEELELGFETSMSDDEEHDSDSNILHGNLNLRIHQRGDSRENVGASGSCESPSSSSSQNGTASYQVCFFIFHRKLGQQLCLFFSSYFSSLITNE